MSTADEVFVLLDGTAAEVVERVQEIGDHSTLMVAHLAERRGRMRPTVLKALEARGLEVEAPGALHLAAVERDVAELIAAMTFSRPESPPLDPALEPDDLYPVPADEDFTDARTGREFKFMLAPDLDEIGGALVDTYEHLAAARLFKVRYLWKDEGGNNKGRPRLGYCRKLSGEARFFGGVDFIVAVGADHCRSLQLTYHQMQALVFHELMHIDQTEHYAPAVIGHDAELFYAELDVFGPWRRNLRPLKLQPELL